MGSINSIKPMLSNFRAAVLPISLGIFLIYTEKFCWLAWIRTRDSRIFHRSKHAILSGFFLYFMVAMEGSERLISGIGSDHSAAWATTTAQSFCILTDRTTAFYEGQKQGFSRKSKGQSCNCLLCLSRGLDQFSWTLAFERKGHFRPSCCELSLVGSSTI